MLGLKARQNVGPDMDSNCSAVMVFMKKIWGTKMILKKNQQLTKKHAKFPIIRRVKGLAKKGQPKIVIIF